MTQPIEVECPYCHRPAGLGCVTLDMHPAKPHAARKEAAVQVAYNQGAKRLVEIDLDEGVVESTPQEFVPYRLEGWAVEDVPRPKSKGPFAGRSKLPYIVRVKTWVWCDKHEGFHEAANTGKYDGVNCGRLFWRRAYVETDDKKEAF